MPDSKSRKLAGAYQSSAQNYQLKTNRYTTFDSADITTTIVNNSYIGSVVDSSYVTARASTFDSDNATGLIDSSYVNNRVDNTGVQTALATVTYGTVGSMAVAKYLHNGSATIGQTLNGSQIVGNTLSGQSMSAGAPFTGTWRNLGADAIYSTSYSIINALLVRIA